MSLPEFHSLMFYVLAILTGLCAVGVVVTQNIVRSAAWLLFTLCGVAGLFFLLGADFVGATQLIVYVGGTLVLVVFGVMLTAQGPFVSLKISAAEWGLSGIVGLLLFGVLALTVCNGHWPSQQEAAPATTDSATSNNTVLIGHGLLGQPVGPDKKTSYLLPFEIVSVHLLVVLIGAAYLARAKRRRGSDHA
jgi:NADH:ubiquinone oxidoreductase subunit 6 (subunit J)